MVRLDYLPLKKMVSGRKLKKLEDKNLADIKSGADQSKNADETIKMLLKLLEETAEPDQREVIKKEIELLVNLPERSPLEKKQIIDQIDKLNENVKEKEIKLQVAENFIEDIDKIIKNLEVFKKRVSKISFDENEGFIWKTGKDNNISKLVDLTDNIIKGEGKGIGFYSDKEKTNNQLLKLYNGILGFSESKSIKELSKLGEDFGYRLKVFFNLYRKVLGLLGELRDSSARVVAERKTLDEHTKELADKSLAVRLNKMVAEVVVEIDKVVSDRENIIKELEIIVSSAKQIILSSKRDQKFLANLLSPGIIKKIVGTEEMKIKDPYYIEVKSSKSYYNPSYGKDATGVFDREESFERLFKQKPTFDNDNSYSMNDNINGLIDSYVNNGDAMMDHFSAFRDELLSLVKRSPKLDPKIKAILVIPAYNEEKVIQKTLERYSSCDNFENVAIVLFENMPVGTKRDMTLAKVQLFRMNHPNVKVYHLFKSFAKRMPIGYLRKYATEYALLLKRYSQHAGNLIFVGGDADCISIKPKFFTNIITQFERYPTLDAMEMKMDFPLVYRMVYPNLWVMHRIFDFAFIYMRRKINPHQAVRMYGPASAIKASSYIMVKGFNPRTRICEDLQLSWLLDEARRTSPEGQKFFAFSRQGIVTNPRRAIGAYISDISQLDMYDKFEEKEHIREMGWEDIVKGEKNKGILNVGNTYSTAEIRQAIENTKDNKSHKIATTLAYGLQRYIDWWQFKIQKSKWMAISEFEEMIKKVMVFLGIEYNLEYRMDHWTITILNIDALEVGMDEQLAKMVGKDPLVTMEKISVDLSTYKRIKLEPTDKEFRLLLLGHTSGKQGEVSTSTKLLEIANNFGLPSQLVDVFELIPKPLQRENLTKLTGHNIDMAHQGKIDTNPLDNPISKYGDARMQFFYRNFDSVVLYVTWPLNQLGLTKLGITKKVPTLAWFYPYVVKEDTIYHPFFRETTIITTFTPLTIKYLLFNGVPKHKIVLIPSNYPPLADKVYASLQAEGLLAKRLKFFEGVEARTGKKYSINEDTLIFGISARIINMYNQAFILERFREMASELENFVVILRYAAPKLGQDTSQEFIDKFAAVINEIKDEPWFLWDKEFYPFEEVMSLVSLFDVSVMMGPAGVATIEQRGLGVTMLLLDFPVNRGLHTDGHHYFVKMNWWDAETSNSEPNVEDFKDKIRYISKKRKKIKNNREKIREFAVANNSSKATFDRMKLAIDAAKSYHYNDKNVEAYRKIVTKQVDEELSKFGE